MKNLEGKVAILTGSGRGSGRAIELMQAGEGKKGMVNDLDAAPAEETIAKICALHGKGESLHLEIPGKAT
jgi:3-oxoacyl-[acyl-carrier protein] reductase